MKTRQLHGFTLLYLFFFGTISLTGQKASAEFYEKFQLRNGLRVIVVPEASANTTTCKLFLDYPLHTLGRLAGLPEFCLNLAAEAAAKEKMDLATVLKTDAHSVYAQVPKKDTETLLSMLAALVKTPHFDPEALEHQKTDWIQQLNQESKSPQMMGDRIGQVLRFSGHPYAEITTTQTLQHIQIADCQDFWDHYVHPNLSYLVISGDLDLPTAKSLIEKYFGDWPAKPSYKSALPGPEFPLETTNYLLLLPQAEGYSWQLSYPFYLKWGNKDALPAVLAAEVFRLKLQENLAKRELSFTELDVDLKPDRHFGYFRVSLKPDHPGQFPLVSGTVRETIQQLATTVQNEVILESAKKQLMTQYHQSLKDPEQLVDFALATVRYKLAKDFYPSIETSIAALTTSDLQTVIPKYFTADPVNILLVGSAQELGNHPILQSFGSSLKYVDQEGHLLQSALAFSPGTLDATQILEHYLQAIGGTRKLGQIGDLIWLSQGQVGGKSMETLLKKKIGSKINLSIKNNGTLETQIKFDGVEGGIWNKGTAHRIEGLERQRLEMQSAIFPELIYLDSTYQKEKMGTARINGIEAYQLRITAPNGLSLDLFYDLSTGLKVGHAMPGAAGQATVYTYYEDYRSVEGVLFPWKVTTATNDTDGYSFYTVRLLLNQRLADSVFSIQ